MPDHSFASAKTGKRLKILFVAMKYDYGNPANGLSAEHCNFYDVLKRTGSDILYFDFMTLLQRHGRKRMNEELWNTVVREKPDILFCMLYKNEIDKEVMKRITNETETVTANWFSDDLWRFDGFSSRWATAFDWILTVDECVVERYKKLGSKNVLCLQWACNPFVCHPPVRPLKYDVTFVGQPHGDRRAVIQKIRDAGIDVQTWGRGWEQGRLTTEEMMDVFGESRINLNFSFASAKLPLWKRLLGMRFQPQIKGRLVEVPACEGFLLTGHAPGMETYYTPGKEIVVFQSIDDLIEKIRYYLSHEEERAAIAKAGFERTMKDHTYVERFNTIFQAMGFPALPVDDILAQKTEEGTTTDVTITVDKPVVSLVMPVLNGEPYIREAIESILGQTFQDFECIIVDDGSTDSTPAIVAEYAARDSRVRPHRLPQNKGTVTALNTGCELARGAFIALIAADDISPPDRFTLEVNYLQEHPNAAAVGGWARVINGKGEETGIIRHPSSPSLVAWSFFFRNPMAASSVMFRRSMGEAVGWHHQTASEDYDFWSRLSTQGYVTNLPRVLVQYRVWDGNFTASHKPQQEETVAMVIQRMASDLLKISLSTEDARALRKPIITPDALTADDIARASILCRKLGRAFIRSQKLTFLEAQAIRDSVSDYLWVLGHYTQAILQNPLFLLYVYKNYRKKA